MKEVHLTKSIKFINSDNLEIMKSYPDNHFDLAIVDPPYGIDAPNMSLGQNRNKNKSGTSQSVAVRLKKAKFSQGSGKLKNRKLNTMSLDWDVKPGEEYFKELFRISVDQIIFGGNYFDLPPTRCVVCWDKVQPWDNFSQWELVWTSFNKVASIKRLSNKGGNNEDRKIHPTQKPIALYQWIYSKYSKENPKIIDTHLGSASNAIAAHFFGVQEFVGIELNEDYFKSSIDRFRNYLERYPKKDQNISPEIQTNIFQQI